MFLSTKRSLKFFFIFTFLGTFLYSAEEEKGPNHGIVIDFGGLFSKKNPKIDVKLSRNKIAVNSSKITSIVSQFKSIKEKKASLDSHRRAWKEYASTLNRHVPDFHNESVRAKLLEAVLIPRSDDLWD